MKKVSMKKIRTKKVKFIQMLALGVCLGLGGLNGAYADYFDTRQTNQETRIQQGIDSGSITEKEANKLEKQQNRINNVEEKFESDGVLTPKEKFRMEKTLDKSSRQIYKEKHDPQTQYGIMPNNFQPKDRFSGINAREYRQRHRIENGIGSGQLTRGEARVLGKEQGRIRAEEARFKNDGNFTMRERAKVQHDLNHSSNHVWRAKHNNRKR